MTAETTRAVADALVAACRSGALEALLAERYHPEAVSVEASAMPGGSDRHAHGLDAIRGKHDWWNQNFEVHANEVEGPFPHGDDRFAVVFRIDATHKASGERSLMQEVAVYHVDDAGKITREEFFYAM